MNFGIMIANHCAPALTGIKPSNLFSCPAARCKEFCPYVEYLNRQLNPSGIYFRCIRNKEGLSLFFVYRKQKLIQHLSDERIREKLRNLGYKVDDQIDPDVLLQELSNRFKSSEFPHDVAYFLGYPVEDIEAFIERKGKEFKCNGYWKVYYNQEEALKIFSRYSRCRDTLVKRVQEGKKLEVMFSKRLRNASEAS